MNDALLAMLREVLSVFEPGEPRPRLFGGLGVYQVTRRGEDDADLPSSSLARLARLARVTDDGDVLLDVGVDVAARLTALGFTVSDRVEPPPVRWKRAKHWVDIVRPDPAGGGLVAVLAALDRRGPPPVDVDGILVAHPTVLLVLKCYACAERWAQKDFVDIAVLAIDDTQREPARILAGAAGLRAGLPPDVLRALRRVRDHFRSGDSIGPGYFATAFGTELDLSDDVREDDVRARVAQCTYDLLDTVIALVDPEE